MCVVYRDGRYYENNTREKREERGRFLFLVALPDEHCSKATKEHVHQRVVVVCDLKSKALPHQHVPPTAVSIGCRAMGNNRER